LNKSSRGL
jgi:hypothetical protein